MSIAYLVSQFPKPSETFVSREFLSLRKLGLELKPFAFDHPDNDEAGNLDAPARELMADVEYVSNGKLLPAAVRAWPGVFRAWRCNSALQTLCTFKSNRHMRLLRVVALATRLQRDGVQHLHAHWPYATQVAYQVHQLTGIPFSVSIHAHEVEHDYGHFEKVFSSLSFASFCNMAAMERLLSRLPESARSRSHLIYHGVSLERFPALPFPDSRSPIRVLSAGRLTPTKGFDRLLDACARFHRQGGQIKLTILGQGPSESDLRRQAAQLGFSDHLELPGWLPHDQVSAQIGRAHLFALLADTNFHDGLPNVVLEAMASARPVVLSPLPAAAEAVEDGVEGFLLRAPDDARGLVELLSNISRGSAPDLAGMGRAARRRVESAFDESVHARQLKNLFEPPLTDHHGRPPA